MKYNIYVLERVFLFCKTIRSSFYWQRETCLSAIFCFLSIPLDTWACAFNDNLTIQQTLEWIYLSFVFISMPRKTILDFVPQIDNDCTKTVCKQPLFRRNAISVKPAVETHGASVAVFNSLAKSVFRNRSFVYPRYITPFSLNRPFSRSSS